MDRECPYGRRHDFSVKNDYTVHDTRSLGLGFDFCEHPSFFRKPVLRPQIVHTTSFWAPKTWRPKFDPALEHLAQPSRQKLRELPL